MSSDEDSSEDEAAGVTGEGGAAAASTPRLPKHRFALFFGYVGARYQGLQKCVAALV